MEDLYYSMENKSFLGEHKVFCLFLTEQAWSHGGLWTRELGQDPSMLAWVTNDLSATDLAPADFCQT